MEINKNNNDNTFNIKVDSKELITILTALDYTKTSCDNKIIALHSDKMYFVMDKLYNDFMDAYISSKLPKVLN